MLTDRYTKLSSPIRQWDLDNKHVFLRADLNVPTEDSIILDDFRLKALVPTLDCLLDKGAHVTIGTHRGRPSGYNEQLTTAPLAAWFANHGYTQRVAVLENLRFSEDEQGNSMAYAKHLARSIDFYVNDAFASCHRSDTSLVTLPTLFDAEHRGIGFLVEKELQMLGKLKERTEHPACMILGGNKAAEKLRYFPGLCTIATDVLVCPCWTDLLPELTNIAGERGVNLHLPIDYLVGVEGWDGALVYKEPHEITPTDTIISIGPQTAELWKPLIMQAKTLFVNGPMGDLAKPTTTHELRTVLQSVTQAHAYRVVGGGSTVAALKFFNLLNQVDWCSTGGGATLAYLANEPLPALDALLR